MIKRKVILGLVITIICISLLGCNNQSTINDLSSKIPIISAEPNKTKQSSSPTVISIENSHKDVEEKSTNSLESNRDNTKSKSISSILEIYKAALMNKAEFFSTDNKKTYYLNGFLKDQEIYETEFKATHFSILDMDDDKEPEVVLKLTVDDNLQFYEVLHYMNDKVNGYLIVQRALQELKSDGTFIYSSGAADYGVGKLKFESTTYKTDILGYSKSSQGDTNLTVSYYINNKLSTKESFDSFINNQTKKKDTVWYEFSQKNIEAL